MWRAFYSWERAEMWECVKLGLTDKKYEKEIIYNTIWCVCVFFLFLFLKTSQGLVFMCLPVSGRCRRQLGSEVNTVRTVSQHHCYSLLVPHISTQSETMQEHTPTGAVHAHKQIRIDMQGKYWKAEGLVGQNGMLCHENRLRLDTNLPIHH